MNSCNQCGSKCQKETCSKCIKKMSYVPKKTTCTKCGSSCQKRPETEVQLCSYCKSSEVKCRLYKEDPNYRAYSNQKRVESYHRCRQKKTVELIENNNLVDTV